VAHLAEALRYKPEGRGFDSTMCTVASYATTCRHVDTD